MTSWQVLDLIPHRPPMVLIDRIVEAGPEHLVSEAVISADKPFLAADGSLPAWAGIELMAQSIAAYAGVQAQAAGEPIRVGFLLGTRRYESSCARFPAGDVLRISVSKLLLDEQGLGVFECRIASAHGTITANLNVYEPRNLDGYLKGDV